METSLEKLVSELRKEKGPIVVTGPQRSGTTIATKILATELERVAVYEESFDTHNLAKFTAIARVTPNAVIQAPALMYHVVTAEKWPYRTILMRRPIEDIIESAQRIGWEQYESRDAAFPMTLECSDEVYDVLRWKRQNVDWLARNGMETLDYSALASHPLFVQKHKRANFKPRQIKVEP